MSKPVISDAEAVFVLKAFDIYVNSLHVEAAREALSAFLLARVPEPMPLATDYSKIGQTVGFNACREQVLRGKE